MGKKKGLKITNNGALCTKCKIGIGATIPSYIVNDIVNFIKNHKHC